MISRRNLIATCILGAPLFIGSAAFSAEKMDYTPATFDAAQKAGKSILVEIHATWCPTCKAQAPILSELEKDQKFKNLLVIHVDFDSQKDAVKRFGARMQSTLISFRHGQETARSVGDTNRDSIAALLGKAI
jgi:thioredoxin 1